MSGVLYCDLVAIQKVLSADGVNLAIDDDPSSWADAADEASRDIEFYLLQGYTSAQLQTSPWVEFCCRVVAARCLCTRRGNPIPPGIQLRYDDYLVKLEAIMAGTMHVPGLSRRRVDAPTLAIPRVRVGPFGPQTVISRKRGPVRNPPQDYDRHDDQTEPDPPPY